MVPTVAPKGWVLRLLESFGKILWSGVVVAHQHSCVLVSSDFGEFMQREDLCEA